MPEHTGQRGDLSLLAEDVRNLPGNFLRGILNTPATKQRRANLTATQTANEAARQQIDARNALAEMMGTQGAADPSGFATVQQPGLRRTDQALARQANETSAQREARLAAAQEQELAAAEAERNRARMLNMARLINDRISQAVEAGASPEQLGQIFDATAPLVQKVDPTVDADALAFLREQVMQDPSVLGGIVTALDPPPQAAASQRAAQAIGAPQQVTIPGTDQVGLAVPIDMGGGQIRTEFLRDQETGEILPAARFERGLAAESEVTVRGEDGQMQAVVIPGGSAEADVDRTRTQTQRQRQEIEQTERERRQARTARETRVQSEADRLEEVTETIDKAIEDTSALTAGFSSLSAAVPGTPAADLRETLSTIQANVGFDELQRLRDMSPTGGALGQVTERELAFLQSVLGSIAQSQSPSQLRSNLQDLKDQLRQSQTRVRRAFEQDFGAEPVVGEDGLFDFRAPEEQQEEAGEQVMRRNPETGVWEMTNAN